MKVWFNKPKYQNVKEVRENIIPKGSWIACLSCKKQLLVKILEQSLYVCDCGHHFRVSPDTRIAITLDDGSFEELFADISSADPLSFKDAKGSYSQKIKDVKSKLNVNEGVAVGTGKIHKHNVVVAIMDFRYLGGSMGSAVGEKIYQAMLHACQKKTPLIIFSSSGGARMHEGILSLMQMAKSCAGLKQMADKKVPFISVLTDPTMGGVTASFASLGDIIIAEPEAMIGFAGKRVIEQTINEKLPETFQTAEFLLKNGFIDCIFTRKEMREKLAKILSFFKNNYSKQ